MKTERNPSGSQGIDRTVLRLAVFGICIMVAFVALFSRLWFLQVLAAPEYRELAKENRAGARGRLETRRGVHGVAGDPAGVRPARNGTARRIRCLSLRKERRRPWRPASPSADPDAFPNAAESELLEAVGDEIGGLVAGLQVVTRHAADGLTVGTDEDDAVCEPEQGSPSPPTRSTPTCTSPAAA